MARVSQRQAPAGVGKTKTGKLKWIAKELKKMWQHCLQFVLWIKKQDFMFSDFKVEANATN